MIDRGKLIPAGISKRSDWLPCIIFGLLSLVILGPLLTRGYVLSLDMIFTPHTIYTGHAYGLEEWFTTSSAVGSASTPFFMFIQGLSRIIPVWLTEKLILFLVIFLAGLGAYRLLCSKGLGAYFAGILYMINPFTYSRFMAGQWSVLWEYAFTPFAIKAFITLLEKTTIKNAIVVAILSTLVGLVQVQGFLLLFLFYLVILAAKTIKVRCSIREIFLLYKYVIFSSIIFFLLNTYWLVPFLSTKNNILNQINTSDIIFFTSKASSLFGVVFNTASMHGFWRSAYISIQNTFSIWWILFIIILFLSIFGFISYFKDRRIGWLVISCGIAWLVSLALAVGAANDMTKPIFEWLWQHTPLFSVFRDSQKFVALLCLAYASLGGLGFYRMVELLRERRKRIYHVVFIIFTLLTMTIPLIYTYPIFGFYGQLRTVDYPKEWYDINEYLKRDRDDFNVLFLPWHLYMDYSWLPNKDKRLGNPGQQFFQKPVIAGDNIEIPGVYSQSTNPISKYIEFLLANQKNINNLGELLAPLNVKYIILISEADYESYSFLYNQKDMKIELQESGITLFKNVYPTSRVYAVGSVKYISGLEDYLDLSKTQDVMKHLYVIGDGNNVGTNIDTENLNFEEKSPVNYEVKGTSLKYTVFTVPQNVNTNYWEYNGQEPVFQNLGFMPVFSSSNDGGEVKYTRFYRVYLPSYIISGVTLCVIIFYFIYYSIQKRKRDTISSQKSPRLE